MNLGQEHAQALINRYAFATQNMCRTLNDGKDLALQKLKAEDSSRK